MAVPLNTEIYLHPEVQALRLAYLKVLAVLAGELLRNAMVTESTDEFVRLVGEAHTYLSDASREMLKAMVE